MTDDQTAADRERMAKLNRRLVIGAIVLASVVVLAVGMLLAAKFLVPDKRSTGSIERQIERWADRRTPGGGLFVVDCPDPVEWRVGEDFHCIIGQGRQSTSVTVTMENDEGAVTWRVGP